MEQNSRRHFRSIAVFGSTVLLVDTGELPVSCLVMESYHQSCTIPKMATNKVQSSFSVFELDLSLCFLIFRLKSYYSQELVFGVVSVPFTCLAPHFAPTYTALGCKDCSGS